MDMQKGTTQKEYIAAQGPLPNTCVDFWQMCWEQGSSLIVMLTSVKEQGRVRSSICQFSTQLDAELLLRCISRDAYI